VRSTHPKTAGTAIRATLNAILGPEKIYWVGDRQPVSHWQNATTTEFENYKVVGGHVGATAFDKIQKPKVFMAVVREPVRRAISLFDFIIHGPNANHPLRAELQGLSLIEAIEKSHRFRNEIANRQCMLIGGAPNFAAAQRSISEREWFIDCHDNVQPLLERVCDSFGWEPAPLRIENANKRDRYFEEYFTDEIGNALREINKEDTRLYGTLDEASRQRAATRTERINIAVGLQLACSGARPPDPQKNANEPAHIGRPGCCVAEFTAEDAEIARGLVSDGTVLIAKFRPERRACPTIYVRDASLRNPRVANSVEYLYRLISEYILNDAHYERHERTGDFYREEFRCIFQVGDYSEDVESTLAYGAKGTKTTLIPDLFFWRQRGYVKQRQRFDEAWVPWKDRTTRAFWRGSTTGSAKLTAASISNLPRYQLCAAANSSSLKDVLDAKLTGVVQANSPDEAERIKLLLENQGLFSKPVPEVDFIKYRFQVDIDGNQNSWSLLPKLLMGSCVLKVVSSWRQWYYGDLRPWEHYVSVRNDLSDLEEKVAWCMSNDGHAEEIAVNGRKYASGIVFADEMTRAAGAVLKASRDAADQGFKA
jgi:hypothetical protein